MPLSRVERLLQERIGLDVSSIGHTGIEHAVNRRLRACHIASVDAYCAHVEASATELQALVEAVVVPETWFFRDPAAFAALTGVVAEQWRQRHPDGVLRLLSLPCATGEEPYSMAMALFDAGWAADRFQIDAFDISTVALAHAREGLYAPNSFRGADLSFRDRYFVTDRRGAQLAERVRRQVRFHQGNVFAASFQPEGAPYDAIFCRNMMIYFDRAGQLHVTGLLTRLLAPDGFVFVGSSESGVLLNSGFSSSRLPMAFAFRPDTAVTQPPRQPRLPAAPPPPAPRPARIPPPPQAVVPVPSLAAPEATLQEARHLADQGRFAEAARRCEEYLRRHAPVAEAFYLLGLVRDADGHHADAVGHYRKALYLDPAHVEAATHLALLLDEQGKSADARVLRERLTRLERARVR